MSFLGHFQLPVGTSTGDMKPGSAYPSHRASMIFRNSGTSAMHDIPKCIIFLLRNEPAQGIGNTLFFINNIEVLHVGISFQTFPYFLSTTHAVHDRELRHS